MNTSEGMRRLAAVIRVVGTLIGFAAALHGFPPNWHDAILGTVILIAAWGIAWVVDGFGAPPKN